MPGRTFQLAEAHNPIHRIRMERKDLMARIYGRGRVIEDLDRTCIGDRTQVDQALPERSHCLKCGPPLWDRAENELAAKATATNYRNAFALSVSRGSHSGSIRARSFLAHIGWATEELAQNGARREAVPGLSVVRAAPFALPRNSRKTERGAKQFLASLWCAPHPLRFQGKARVRCNMG